jgi:hypothetical protein
MGLWEGAILRRGVSPFTHGGAVIPKRLIETCGFGCGRTAAKQLTMGVLDELDDGRGKSPPGT